MRNFVDATFKGSKLIKTAAPACWLNEAMASCIYHVHLDRTKYKKGGYGLIDQLSAIQT